MATFSIAINERTAQGKALLAYLETLKVNLQRISHTCTRKGSLERSMDDIKHGRVESFASADELCNALGI